MALRRWHWGKVVLLWGWGVALCLALIQVIIRTASFVPGFALIGVLLFILLTLSIITWKWLGGKEQ
jgi:hypothetical protein